jgi:hypothetical protein
MHQLGGLGGQDAIDADQLKLGTRGVAGHNRPFVIVHVVGIQFPRPAEHVLA